MRKEKLVKIRWNVDTIRKRNLQAQMEFRCLSPNAFEGFTLDDLADTEPTAEFIEGLLNDTWDKDVYKVEEVKNVY